MGVAPDSELPWPLCAGKGTSCHAAEDIVPGANGGSEHMSVMAKDPVIVTSGKGGSVIGTCQAVVSSDYFHVGAQPIQEPIPCLWRTSWSPNCLEGGAGRLGMVQGRDKDLCDIRAGDSIAQG